MSMFDSIINEAGEKFNLGGKAGTLLSALLALMTDKNRGGFAGFLEKFNTVGLGDTVSSWVSAGTNTPVSNEQIESALGEETLKDIANQTGTDYQSATSATAYMTPRVIDALTPEGVVPQESDLLSRIGGYLTGGAASGGISAANVGESFDRIGTAAIDDNVRAFDRTGNALNTVDDTGGDNSPLRWLLPLLLLGLLIGLGYMFCGKSSVPTAPTANTTTNVNGTTKTTNTNIAK